MKKNLLFTFATTAVLILTGCSSDVTDSSTPEVKKGPSPVGFKSFVEKNTKASTTPSGNLTHDFWVFAYYDATGDNPSTNLSPDFMYNQRVIYSINGFSYTPIKYWPSTGDVNFYAFTPNTPANLTVTNPTAPTSTGYPILTYTVNSSVIDQEDLLVAQSEDEDGMAGSVNFAFDHALTKVSFAARTAGNYVSQGATITIKSIQMSGIINSGSFSYDVYSNTPDLLDQWWTVGTNEASYSPTLNANGVVVPYFDDVTKYLVVNPSDQFLLMIPQNFDGTDATMHITYEVSYTDGTATKSFTRDIPLDNTLSWLPGISLSYAITISLQTVTFTATVNDWIEAYNPFLILPDDGE